jgi:hypothetical protein
MRGVFVLGVVAVVGLLLMIGVSAFGMTVELNGLMYDSEGKRLYPTEGDNYWMGADGTRFDIDPSDTNYLVAKSLDGVVVGTGRLSGIDYELNLQGGGSQHPVLLIYAGFYDPVRPDRTQLLYCTSIETSRIPQARKVFVDITCDGITMFEGSTGAYR